MRTFAVAHVTKISSSGGIGSHIDRKHKIKNADPSRTYLNQEYSLQMNGTLQQDINQRIKEGYTSTRAIRKDAVKAVGVIFSGSHEKMKKLENNGQLDEWVKKNYEFAKKSFGEKNIVRFTLHVDEKTPHVHCVFTPIDKNGKLRFKSFFDGKKDFQKFQDNYAAVVNKFGLERGLKNSRTRHTTTRQFYTEINNQSEKFEVVKGLLGKVKVEETTQAAQNMIARQAAIAFRLKKEKERAESDLFFAKKDKEKASEKKNSAMKANKGFVKQQEQIQNILKIYLNPNSKKENKEKAYLILHKFTYTEAFKKVDKSVKVDVKSIIDEDKKTLKLGKSRGRGF